MEKVVTTHNVRCHKVLLVTISDKDCTYEFARDSAMQHDFAIILPLSGRVPARGEPLVLLFGPEVPHGGLPLARRGRHLLPLRHSQHVVVEQRWTVTDPCGCHLGLLFTCFYLEFTLFSLFITIVLLYLIISL